MNKIRYGNSVISYTVVKTKRRKTSEIIVNKNGIEIRTPLTKKDSEIKQLVDDKKQWIFKKKLEFSDKRKIKLVKTKSVSEKYLQNKTWKLALKIGVKPSKVVIKKLKGRWGSSTKDGIINLNVVLTSSPRKIQDYVIIHELCHIQIREHSRLYWNLVRRFMPEYKECVKWLDRHTENAFLNYNAA